MSFMNLNAIEQAVNAELNNVHDWLTTNRLTLNTKKNQFRFNILIHQNLLWKKHVDSVIIKITEAIGMIAKLNYFVPSTVLVNIYNSLI